MHGKKQIRNLRLAIISRAATAAVAIAVVFPLTVVSTQSTLMKHEGDRNGRQGKTPATANEHSCAGCR